MKTIFYTITLFFISICVGAQEYNIVGIINDISVDKNFGEGQEAIKTSILDNLENLNLYEYAHALNEIYELMHTGKITSEAWNDFIKTLQNEVQQEKLDTIYPFYATDYKGIIPLQAEYFLSSLEINTKLRNQFSSEYENLKNSTSALLGQGYTNNEIDSLLVLFPKNSTIGTVNFWLFTQVYGCQIIELGIKKVGVERMKMLLRNLQMTSTYKTPLRLQFRKYHVLKQKIKSCLKIYEIELKGETAIRDKEKESYYKLYLKEGIDKNKTKDF